MSSLSSLSSLFQPFKSSQSNFGTNRIWSIICDIIEFVRIRPCCIDYGLDRYVLKDGHSFHDLKQRQWLAPISVHHVLNNRFLFFCEHPFIFCKDVLVAVVRFSELAVGAIGLDKNTVQWDILY